MNKILLFIYYISIGKLLQDKPHRPTIVSKEPYYSAKIAFYRQTLARQASYKFTPIPPGWGSEVPLPRYLEIFCVSAQKNSQKSEPGTFTHFYSTSSQYVLT